MIGLGIRIGSGGRRRGLPKANLLLSTRLWDASLNWTDGTKQTIKDLSGAGNHLRLGSTVDVDANDPTVGAQGSTATASQYFITSNNAVASLAADWTVMLTGRFQTSAACTWWTFANGAATSRFQRLAGDQNNRVWGISYGNGASVVSGYLAIPSTEIVTLCLSSTGGVIRLERMDTRAYVELEDRLAAYDGRIGINVLANSAMGDGATSGLFVACDFWNRKLNDGERRMAYAEHRRAVLSVGLTPLGTMWTGPMASFVFDDGNVTDLTVMKPVFDAKGAVACSALVPDILGTGGYLTEAQAHTLEDAGWEILGHSKTHVPLDGLDDAALTTEVGGCRSALRGMGFNVNNFVYPWSWSTQTVEDKVRQYFRSGRDTSTGTNVNPITPYRLKGNNFDTPADLATIQGRVDTAVANRSWIIVYGHQTDAADATAWGTLIDYIQGKGIPILTVNQALDRIGAPMGGAAL